MPKRPLEFVKHFLIDEDYVTSIWFDTTHKQYSSVLTDLKQETFNKLEDIELRLIQLMEDIKHGR